jgi:acetylserotonin N-methyltransferase
MTDPVLLPILDLIEAFRRSKPMFAAVQMGVFDFLNDAPAPASTVAAHIHAAEDTTRRLLDACVGLGLLARRGENYLNLAATQRLLCRNSPETMTGYIHYSNEVLYPMWGHLEDAIREGSNRWEQVYGKQGSTLFDQFFSTDEKLATFVQGMHGFGMLSSASVVTAFDLSRFRHLCDLGGATGHLTIAACERYPQLRGTVFDLPRVIPIRPRASALIACPATSFRTHCRQPIFMPWAEFCTTGQSRAFTNCSTASFRLCPRVAVC